MQVKVMREALRKAGLRNPKNTDGRSRQGQAEHSQDRNRADSRRRSRSPADQSRVNPRERSYGSVPNIASLPDFDLHKDPAKAVLQYRMRKKVKAQLPQAEASTGTGDAEMMDAHVEAYDESADQTENLQTALNLTQRKLDYCVAECKQLQKQLNSATAQNEEERRRAEKADLKYRNQSVELNLLKTDIQSLKTGEQGRMQELAQLCQQTSDSINQAQARADELQAKVQAFELATQEPVGAVEHTEGVVKYNESEEE